jgi:hypothetical protein
VKRIEKGKAVMKQQPGKKELFLGDAFGDVVVKVNGVIVEIHTDGSILVATNGPVKLQPIANGMNLPATTAQKPGQSQGPHRHSNGRRPFSAWPGR